MDPQSFSPYSQYSEYSPFGRNYGNPLLNGLMFSMFGFNYMPQMQSGQDMYDAFLQRSRSAYFMNLQRSSFMNNPYFQALGINKSPMAGMMGRAFGSPDGMLAKAMSPLVGGNPMAASMQLYAGLTGAFTMGGFGRTSDATADEVEGMMQALAQNFYNYKKYDGPQMKDLGVGAAGKSAARDIVKNKLAEGAEGVKYLEREGILGVNSQNLDKFDITDEKTQRAILEADQGRKRFGIDMEGKLNDTLKSTDERNRNQKLDELINIMKKNELSKDKDFQKAKNADGTYNPEKIREIIKETSKSSELVRLVEQDREARGRAEKSGKEEMQDKAREFIRARLKEGDTGRAYLDSIGLKDVNEGNVDKFDITNEQVQNEIKNAEITRRVKSADLHAEFKKALEEEDDDDRSDKIEELVDKMRKDTKTFRPEDLDRAKKKDGTYDEQKVEKLITGLSKTSQLDVLVEQDRQYREAGKKFAGFSFENSRGFKIEDFTSAFYKAGEQRLMGGNKNESMADKMYNFSKNAGGAMDAARSLFGNGLSGSEYMQKISDMLGSSAKNLGSEDGASAVEDMLRKAKATARVAGMSVEAMLGIIESAKDIARNNPQLQYMNSAATADMTMKAVSTAASMGAAMRPEDYRKAGGAQGLTSQLVTSTQAYLSSGLGGSKAALMAMATQTDDKGNETPESKALKERISKADASEMNGIMMDVAKLKNMSPGELYSAISNPLLQQEALSDESISSSLEAGAQETIEKSFDNGLQRYTGGEMSVASLKEKYLEMQKKGPVDLQKFLMTEVYSKLSGPEAQEFVKQYKPHIQKMLVESGMSEEQKNKIYKAVEEQAAAAKQLSKDFAGRNAPIITQAIDAIAKGENTEDTAQALAGIFATKNSDSERTKMAMEEARKGGMGIAAIAASEGSDIDKAKDMASEINKVQAARRIRRAEELGGGSDAEAKAASEIRDVTEEGIKNMASTLQASTASTAKEAREQLADLRKQAADPEQAKRMSPEAKRMLEAYDMAENAGMLRHDSSWNRLRAGKVRNVGAAVLETVNEDDKKKYVDAQKQNIVTSLDKQLQEVAKGTDGNGPNKDIQDALAYYNGKDESGKSRGGVAQMLKDWSQPFDGSPNNYFKDKEKRSKLESSGLGSYLNTANEDISKMEKDIMAKGGSPEDKSREDMKKMFEGLTAAIQDGGGIRNAILDLIREIK